MALKFNGKTPVKLYYDGKKVCNMFYNSIQIWQCNTAPTVGDNSATLINKSYTFGTGSFTNNFTDADGDSYKYVTIEGTPNIKGLEYLGTPVTSGLKFLVENVTGLKFRLDDKYAIYQGVTYEFSKSIDAIIADYELLGYKLFVNSNGVLEFRKPEDETDKVLVKGVEKANSAYSFIFKTSDNSFDELDSNIATFNFTASGDINVKAVYVNQPPVVGDNTITTNRGTIEVLERDVFLANYSDIDGDAAYELRIDTLPTNGVLELRGVAVTVGQVMSFVNDIDDNALVFIPDNDTSVTQVSFGFSVSDVGSKIFS